MIARGAPFVFVAAWLAAPSVATAATVEAMPGDDIEAIIATLQPGDELVLHGGMYTVTERFGIDIAGTEQMPIVIRAADGEVAHIHRPDAAQNLVDIDSATWVEIRGIEFSGGSAGLRISGADHLTIADCNIHDTNDVALRANDSGVTYQSLHIVHNEIHHTNNTGEGMYLGCNGDGCRIADSIIERNWVHHTNQATVDQGDGIEIKEGSYGNVVRDNVIHDTNYPCILTYSTVGNGDPNVIERNVMWNCGDHAIQSAADAVIRNNIILGANADGIAMQPHQSGNPSNLTVVHNTVLNAGGAAISLRDAVAEVVIANNAAYSEGGAAIFVNGNAMPYATLAANVGMGGAGGLGGYTEGSIADFVDGHFGGTPPIDVVPAAGGGLVGTADAAYLADDDFNTTPRDGALDVGAYLFDPDGNPGWEIQEGFKEFPDDPPGGTDTGGTDGTGDGGDTADGGGTGGSADAGTSGPSSAGTDGSQSGSATDGSSGGMDEDDGGCGCRTSSPRPTPIAAGFWVLVAAVRRRR
jgi:hypothetical protein